MTPFYCLLRRFLPALTGLALIAPMLAVFALSIPNVQAQQIAKLRIGVVNLNDAINRTAAGKRSKKVLLASKAEKEKRLKAKEKAFAKEAKALQQNIVLKPTARKRKEERLHKKRLELQQEVRTAQSTLQIEERKLTEALYIELRQAVKKIARRERLDIVLEKGAAQVILYMNNDFIDITKKLILEHNQSIKSKN